MDDNAVTPTYRHLLSATTLNARNPLRAIALCDIDAFYAQAEGIRLGIDPSKPVACQQWQGLIAVNYPAREFGITRHQSVTEAKLLCPDLIACHVATYKEGENQAGYYEDAKPETHKVSLEPYRRESRKIIDIFQGVCPNIEKASIDEAYLDLTLPVRQLILKRNPHLASAPESGLDTPLPPPPMITFAGLGNLIPLPSEENIEHEPLTSTWSDYAIALGAELMAECRSRVKSTLGYTCSAGIARNKILAKLCAGYKKPDNQTILREAAIPSFLSPMKFSKIRSLGGKLGQQIAEELDANTVADLWPVSLEEMQRKIGHKSGTIVWEIIRGIDKNEVTPKTAVKTMLSSKNFKPSITKWTEAQYWLRVLSVELFARLTEARDISPGVWPKTIVFGIRDGNYVTRHTQAPFPHVPELTIETIQNAAEKLLKELTGLDAHLSNGAANVATAKDKALGLCTNLSLSFGGLDRGEKGQQGIKGFFEKQSAKSPPAKKRKLNSRSRSASSEIILLDEQPSFKALEKGKGKASNMLAADDKPTFYCDRCKKHVTVSRSRSASVIETGSDGQELELTEAEKRARDVAWAEREHADEHFARDLAKKDRPSIRPGNAPVQPKKASSKPTVRKKKERDKITSFFTKRS